MTFVERIRGRDALGTSQPIVWDETPRMSAEEFAAAFDHTLSFTIGVEEELMLVDPVTFDLAPVIGEVLPLLDGDERFAKELRAAQIEIVTPVCATATDACRVLADARADLVAALDGEYRLLACGAHPFSTRHGEITEAERYRQIADEYVWAATRSMACGLHVHVAVPGSDRALAVYNALRSYLPEIGALSANSAYVEGRDTGMASIRPKLNDAYPRSGVPPAFRSWEELVRFVDWGRSGGLFPDSSHFWWDLRPHPVHGTIEIRIADTQTTVADATAVVAVVQALVAMLTDRFDSGEALPLHETYWIGENSWRAHRHGVRGWLVDLDDGGRVATRDRLASLFDELEPYAEQLDTLEQMDTARALLIGNGADRQRYVHEREGILGLTRWLVEETEAAASHG
jgi:carboxylate-amine ligase